MPTDIARDENNLPATGRYSDGACRTGWALDATGHAVHVSEVANGYSCRCRCVTCGQPLSARQGPKNIWHFAHQHHVLCVPESALHRAAKEILADAAREQAALTLQGRETTGLRSAELEVRIPSGRVVDVMVGTIGPTYAVEIAVTHRKTSPAAADILGDGYRGLEIDLSRVPASASRVEVRQAVLHDAPRHWLEAPPKISASALIDQRLRKPSRPRAEQGRQILTHIHGRLERDPKHYAGQIPWPQLRARAARFTATLDMTDAMRDAAHVRPWLMAVDSIQYEQLNDEGGLQLTCPGAVATDKGTARARVCFYLTSFGPASIEGDMPTLMIGCPDDLTDWPHRLSMDWRGIEHWYRRLDSRWQMAIKKR